VLLATSRLWSYVVECRQIKEWRAALRRNDVGRTIRRFVSSASLTSHARAARSSHRATPGPTRQPDDRPGSATRPQLPSCPARPPVFDTSIDRRSVNISEKILQLVVVVVFLNKLVTFFVSSIVGAARQCNRLVNR